MDSERKNMNQKTHKQQHDHDHKHKESSSHRRAAKRAPHRDWRFWTVIAMLVGIGIYVLTLDEVIGPAGVEVPAAVDAP